MGRTTEILRKFPRFVLTEGLGTVVDTAVLWLLSRYAFHSYAGDYLLAPVISFECAVFTNYCTASLFVWRDRMKQIGVKRFFRKYVFYNLSSSAVFLARMCVLLLLERFFGWDVVICNLVALCISGLANFSMAEWVIFRRRQS